MEICDCLIMFSTVRDFLDHLNRFFFPVSITFIEKQWEAKAHDATGKELIVRPMCPFFHRRAPPGKCRVEPVPVKVKSKLIKFVPKESKCHCCWLLWVCVSWQ